MKRLTATLAAVLLMLFVSAPAFSAPQEEALIFDNGGLPITGDSFLAQMGYGPETEPEGVLYLGEEPLEAGSFAATGQTVHIYDGEGNLIGSRDVIIIGDVIGTGKAGINQVKRLAYALSGEEPLHGIWKIAADINGSGEIDINDLVAASQEVHEVERPSALLTEKTIPLHAAYDIDESIVSNQISLAFLDGQTQIPYIRDDVAFDLLRSLLGWVTIGGELTSENGTEPGVAIWERENGSFVEIDFQSSRIWFDDFSLFYKMPRSSTVLNIVDTKTSADIFIPLPESSFDRMGRSVTMDMNAYGIDFVFQDGHGYLPLQTFTDAFLTSLYVQTVYNGEECFVISYGGLGTLTDEYYSVPAGMRSQELADFTYNELCFAMDTYYGLKPHHDITDFDSFFEQTGLKEQLLNADPREADRAIWSMTEGYLGDNHSAYKANSPYSGENFGAVTDTVSPSVIDQWELSQRLLVARDMAFPAGVPAYQEVGDTAYVTFDRFVYTDVTYTEENLPFVHDPELSTLGLIRYAQQQISRENSPIKKVVMDLSCNKGGDTNAAVLALCWFQGTGTCSLTNTVSGAQSTLRYNADLNGDGFFNIEQDSVALLKRYCLIGAPSFSCGNFVPANLKNTGVTILGAQSGGGASFVTPLSMADGTLFNISGPIRANTLKNGSYYDVDQGIIPDVAITDPEHYYQREYLNEKLVGLLR